MNLPWSQLNPDYYLIAFFSAIGLVVILLMFFSKIVYVFLCIANGFLPKKYKIRFETRTKSLYTPTVGTCFVIVLAIAADNPYIYGLSVIIIATLITELEFLEKVMALFWNRKDYWDYRAQIDGRGSQQTDKSSPEEKEILEKIDKKLEKSDGGEKTIENPNTQEDWLLLYHFERTYRLIFGQQIGWLQWLNMNEQQGITIGELRSAYSTNPLSTSYAFEKYIGFLETSLLVKYDGSVGRYHITFIGKSFLAYMATQQLPTNKLN